MRFEVRHCDLCDKDITNEPYHLVQVRVDFNRNSGKCCGGNGVAREVCSNCLSELGVEIPEFHEFANREQEESIVDRFKQIIHRMLGKEQ